jgi:hypothetical protein
MPVDLNREARVLETALTSRGLVDFRVVKRGKALTIVSGPEGDPEPEARLVLVHASTWRLDLRHHSGKWERTPFVGGLAELVDDALSIGRLNDPFPSSP